VGDDSPGSSTIEDGLAVALNPRSIRLSQTSVRGAAEIINSMKANGWVGPPIDVVRMPDGGLTAVDNTRVVAAGNAGIDVQAIIHPFDEPLPDMTQVDRFTTPKGVPATWGDAVLLRIGKQSAAYRNRWPMGSPYTSWDGN
jgi:filamentous hemagglutinin